MNTYRISAQASVDLIDIWLYIAEDSVRHADEFTDEVRSKFPLLAQCPECGPRRDDLAPGLRSHPVDNYVIFYRAYAQGIEIVRVVHGARDIGRLF